MTVITVVTIGWNDLQGIMRTFESLNNQTFDDVEHLIIDGGSTDGSVEWVRRHTVFRNSIVVSERDAGIYDAMNKGLRMATGDVVHFLNSGDCLGSPDVLMRVADSFGAARWEWALGASQMVDKACRPMRKTTRVRYSWWRQTFWYYEISQQAVFIRTDILRKNGGFDQRFSIAGDYHLVTKLGRVYQPTLLPMTAALTLAGGISDRRLSAAHWQAHSARVDILSLGPVTKAIDVGWTGFLIAKVWARRLTRRLMRRRLRPESRSGMSS